MVGRGTGSEGGWRLCLLSLYFLSCAPVTQIPNLKIYDLDSMYRPLLVTPDALLESTAPLTLNTTLKLNFTSACISA